MRKLGINTIADLLRKDDEFLVENFPDAFLLGKIGQKLADLDLYWGLLYLTPKKIGL